MRYPVVFFLLLAFLSGNSQTKKQPVSKPADENFNCSGGLMKNARYPYNWHHTPSLVKETGKDFIILVDTNYKSARSIKAYNNPDSIDLSFVVWYYEPTWDSFPQRRDCIDGIRRNYRRWLDSVRTANEGPYTVRIINNSNHPVTLQTQDGSFICIMQALTKSGQWRPIQYWEYAWCGNSYKKERFPPKTGSEFDAIIPNHGDYITKLRFKLLGKDKFYYSNEFIGKIDYCEFVENPEKHRYKFDKVIDLNKDWE